MKTLNERSLRGYAGADLESIGSGGLNLAVLGLPRSRREAGLAVGWLLVAALGIVLLTGTDPAGAGFVVIAAVGYLFLHSRWLGSTLAGLVVVSGLYQLSQGNSAGAVVGVIGVLQFGLTVDIGRLLSTLRSKAATAPDKAPILPIPDLLVAQPIDQPETADGAFAGLRVRTIGQFRLEVGDRDLTPELLDRPMLAFIWEHLLARAIRNPEERMPRTALADEVAPGLPSQTQGDRLRGHVHDLQHKLPEELTATIEANRTTIRVVIDGMKLDVDDLRRLERSVGSGRLFGVETAVRILSLLEKFRAGEFLPGFEELENRVTGGRGVAGELLKEVRGQINTSRGNLAGALADHYVAVGKPDAAIPILETSLRLDANREDLARLLVQVHVRCGHTVTAANVTRQFGLSGEA